MTDPTADSSSAGFEVLFVCTGNVCRSPMAEAIASQLLVENLGPEHAGQFRLSSAGTYGPPGNPIDPLSRAELAQWGLDGPAADSFRSKVITPGLIESADLVLTADHAHRSEVVQMAPAALGYTFCLREFSRLVAAVDPATLPADPVVRGRAIVQAARDMRGLVLPVPPEEDEIPDPRGRDESAHHLAATMIREELTGSVATVWGTVARS